MVEVTNEGGVAGEVLLVMAVALNAGSKGTCLGNVARGPARVVTSVGRRGTLAGSVRRGALTNASTAKRKATFPESVPSQRLPGVEDEAAVEGAVVTEGVEVVEGLVVAVAVLNVERRVTCLGSVQKEEVVGAETLSVTTAKKWVTCPGSAPSHPTEGEVEGGEEEGVVGETEVGVEEEVVAASMVKTKESLSNRIILFFFMTDDRIHSVFFGLGGKMASYIA